MPLYVPQHFGTVVHSMRLVGDNEPMAATYGISMPNDVDAADVSSFAVELHDAFGDFLQSWASNQHTLVQTEVRFQIAAPPADPFLTVASGTRTGGGTSTTLPQNSAYLVHKRTAAPGRRGRGRFYLPSVAEAVVGNNGAVDSSFITTMQGWLNAFLARFNVAPWEGCYMTLLHQYEGALPDPVPATLYPNVITSLVLDPVIATQRKRLRR